MSLDLESVRKQFPQLSGTVHGKPLIYLDNAATTLKPQTVIDSISTHYSKHCSNIHRGVHYLSEQGTLAYEHTRELIHSFLNSRYNHEIIFTKGTTESICLVANSFGQQFIKENDEIILTAMEHHSNIVPWQLLCERTGAKLKVAPMNEKGELILEEYKKLLSEKTKLVACVYISNSLGTINPIREMITLAHAKGAKVLIDGAQAVAHLKVDVQELDCDFFAFSGHKIFGPTGVGVLYGKEELLNQMPPYQGGGDMIETVSFEKTTYAPLPHKFEAGTPAIAEVIALAKALEYVSSIGLDTIKEYESELLAYATEQIKKIPGVRIIGEAKKKASVLSFVMDNVHPHDIGTLSDQDGVALRTGHHCTQPVMQFFKIPATARASFALYNTKEEIDKLMTSIHKINKVFS